MSTIGIGVLAVYCPKGKVRKVRFGSSLRDADKRLGFRWREMLPPSNTESEASMSATRTSCLFARPIHH
jgi:hypothetical protein